MRASVSRRALTLPLLSLVVGVALIYCWLFAFRAHFG